MLCCRTFRMTHNFQIGDGSAIVSADRLSVIGSSPTDVLGRRDSLLLATVTDFGVTGISAQINWGSGASVSASIVDNGNGTFSVLGNYVFSTLGSQAVSVTVCAGTIANTVTSTVNVVGASFTATAVDSVAIINLALANQSVATFYAANSEAVTGDFAATINWNDGSDPESGTIVANDDGSFSVNGSHTYSAAGDYSVQAVFGAFRAPRGRPSR